MARDEVFHGHNPSEGQEPSGEVIRVDTLMASARKAHGDFSLRYSDTVLNTGNGRVWADWAVTGIRAETLFAVPYVAWFSQRHRLVLKFGWWEVVLILDGVPFEAYRVKSWYEAGALPVSRFTGGATVQAWCSAVPGAARLTQQVSVLDAPELRSAAVVLRGATVLGEEAGSPYDAVNGTVGASAPLAVSLDAAVEERALVVANRPAGLLATLRCTHPVRCTTRLGSITVPTPAGLVSKDQLHFEVCCPLREGGLPVADGLEAGFEWELSDLPADADAGGTRGPSPHRSLSLPPEGQALRAIVDAWRREWPCLAPLSTPDPQLTAGLRRSAAYAASLLAPVEGAGVAAGMSDHVEWPVDCARDTFHVASALLFLRPELVRQHLAFWLLDAIPRAGAGRSYVGTGKSRGHRQARLLDLAAYPLWHLWRYWRATGDDDFAAQPGVRETVMQIADEVSGWRHRRTGLLTSTERSSDEACVYPVFIPGNAMFAGGLERMARLASRVWDDEATAERFTRWAGELRDGIRRHAVVDVPEFGPVYAFEVGAADEALLYDHADIPNLLSLPRWGFCPTDDPVYRATVSYAYSRCNQGYRGTADGKYRQLCDGSKTMPSSPWPLGALGQLLAGGVTPAEATRLLDWLRDALTPALQLPEICDKHTARPVQRYWFGWPTAMLLMAFVETVCGVRLESAGDVRDGREPVCIQPMVPEGWSAFRSPVLTVRGHQVVVQKATGGEAQVLVDGIGQTGPVAFAA